MLLWYSQHFGKCALSHSCPPSVVMICMHHAVYMRMQLRHTHMIQGLFIDATAKTPTPIYRLCVICAIQSLPVHLIIFTCPLDDLYLSTLIVEGLCGLSWHQTHIAKLGRHWTVVASVF